LGLKSSCNIMGLHDYKYKFDRTNTFRLVYGKEFVMPMDFILSSLCIAKITELSNIGAIEERLETLVQLEEDRFIIGFHQQVQKSRENVWHDRHIKQKKFKS
jgi:hypothetical protein